MYYGSEGVSSASDIDDTFLFGDDFGGFAPAVGFWCWFQEPRAIQHGGKTYFGYGDPAGNVFVSAYNEYGQLETSPVLHSFSADDHINPAILLLPDGRLLVCYSDHSGPTMYCRKSINPDDISDWSPEVEAVSGTYICYPNLAYLSAEDKIYLFYRGSGSEAEWSFVTSDDFGDSWSSEKLLFSLSGQQYFKTFSDGIDTIYFIHSGHPDAELTSVYFFYYKNGNFYKADGTLICSLADLPLSRADMDLVYDASETGVKAWIWDIVVKNGTPYIVFATFPSTSDHRYNYAYWDGSKWVVHEICAAGGYLYADQPYYSGGITIDRESPNIVYLSKQIDGIFEIIKAETSDEGASWSFTNITENSAHWNIRPVAVRNPSDIRVLWGYGVYESYTDFDTGITKDAIPPYTLSKWNTIQGEIEVTFNVLHLKGTTATRGLIESTKSFDYPLVLECRARGKQNIMNSAHFCSLRAPGDWNNRAGDLFGGNVDNTLFFYTCKDGSCSSTSASADLSLWHKYRVIWTGNGAKVYRDDNLLADHTTNVAIVTQVVVFYEAETSNNDAYVDYIFVRKYTEPEPSVSLGEEETA